MRRLPVLLVLAAIGFGVSSIVVLDEREQAFRTLLNVPEPRIAGLVLNRPALTEPGWYVRIPGLHQLHRYDRRLLRYDAEARDLYTSEKLLLAVDYYAIWRIDSPQLFFESIRTEPEALRRIDSITYNELRKTLALHELADLLSEKRRTINRTIRQGSADKLRPLGIELVDLKIRRTDYPDANLERIFRRMQTERDRFAKKFRAEGEERARVLRAEADRDSQIIRARAGREAAHHRGEGDAQAARIYADAYQQDPEFYSFVRSLEAYRTALNDETTLIISPALPFLKYFFEIAPEPTP